MTKSMWLAVSVLILLFTACGFFMVLLQKDEEQKNIHYFLTGNRLNHAVSYQDVSLSFSDSFILKNVAVQFYSFPKFQNETAKFILHDYTETNGIPSHLSFSIKEASFSLMDLARTMKKSDEDVIDTLASFDPAADILNHPLYALLLSGCDHVSADINGKYDYFPASKKMTLKAGFSDKCLGKWEAEISFNNISIAHQKQLPLMLKHFLIKGSPLTDIKNFLKEASVSSLFFSYTETGLIQGYKHYIDTLYLRQPNTPSPAELSNQNIREIISYLSFSNAHRQRNTETAQTLASFIKAPKKITFQSKQGKEVPLHILRGTFLRRLTDLLLRLDTSVSISQ